MTKKFLTRNLLVVLTVLTLGMVNYSGNCDVHAEETGIENVEGDGTENTETGWTFDESTGKITITSGYDWFYNSFDMPWEKEAVDPTKIITAEIDMSGTKNVELDEAYPLSLSFMFEGVSNLESVKFTGETSGKNDVWMGFTFSECKKLTSVDLSGLKGAKITTMSGTFADCSSLTTVNFGDIDTSNVTDMGSMFSGCSSLTSLDVSNFNTEKVTDMGSMFSGCNSLTTIDISNFDFSSIYAEHYEDGTISSRMSSVFDNMNSLKTLKVPANLPYAVFFPYSDTIPMSVTVEWKDASGKVYEEIPAGLATPMTYTRTETAIVVPTPTPDTNTTPGTNLTPIPTPSVPQPLAVGTKIISGSNIYVVTNSSVANPTVDFKGTNNKTAKTVNISSTVTNEGITYKVTSIATNALKNNKKITTVKIGANITKIGKSAFENCKKLKKITISSKGLKSVGKKALKGIHKKCKIKVPAAKLKAYKKLLKGKGQKNTVRITK